MKPLETQLSELQTELKSHFDKAAEEQKTRGAMAEETKTKIDAIQKQVDAIDVRLSEKHAANAEPKPLVEVFKENEDVARLMKDRRGRAVIELDAQKSQQILGRKTVFLTSGTGAAPTTSVLRIDRMGGITTEARQQLTVRDVLSAAPTTMQVVDYVKVNAPLSIASPQVEGSTKAENTITFTSLSERVKTIATFIKASRQILDDFSELMTFLESSLPYYTDLAEELQLLSGNASGENLNGLITQATAFQAGLLSSTRGWNTMDIIGRTIQQITASKEVQPTFVILHPNDWWTMRLTKDGFGRYILGDPQSMVDPTLFGLTVVATTSIAAGTFLVGNGNPAAGQIRDRMGVTVDISTEDQDNFQKNLVTVRCEKRVALIVRRPASFVTGSFSFSPA